MDKGYYSPQLQNSITGVTVAIHNKNGQGLLLESRYTIIRFFINVAIHNKNGQGLLPNSTNFLNGHNKVAIHNKNGQGLLLIAKLAFNRYNTRRNPQ